MLIAQPSYYSPQKYGVYPPLAPYAQQSHYAPLPQPGCYQAYQLMPQYTTVVPPLLPPRQDDVLGDWSDRGRDPAGAYPLIEDYQDLDPAFVGGISMTHST